MRILHLLNTGSFSGAENVACQIINMIKDEPGIEMFYCSREGSIREHLKTEEISFIPIADMTPRIIRNVLKEYKIDVVHAHDMRAGFVAACACGQLPLISHIHNNAVDSRTITPKTLAYFFAACKARHIFWVSTEAMEGFVFRNLFKKKSEVLRNILDPARLHARVAEDANEYAFDVVYLGRMSDEKNPKRLVNVFAEVVKQMPNAKLAMIGDGILFEEVKELAESLQVSNNIQFFGFQKNPYKIVQSAKVMLMTSRWEGLPMCALEAMELGIPVVSTPTDGLKALIKDGENGYLAETDTELAKRVIEILQNEELQLRLSLDSVKISREQNNLTRYRESLMRQYRTSI